VALSNYLDTGPYERKTANKLRTRYSRNVLLADEEMIWTLVRAFGGGCLAEAAEFWH
jgi:hypothetical protein